VGTSTRPILPAVRKWLNAEAQIRDARTSATYATYAGAHWVPHFGTLDGIADDTLLTYRAQRLEKVSASSVGKELGALRAFCRWLRLPVTVPTMPKRTKGNRRSSSWTGAQELSPAEIEAVLDALPMGGPRERYALGYETSLRPATITALSMPEHWHPDSLYLEIPREIDKARAGRPVPLSHRALWAIVLMAACKWSAPCSPPAGPIFGSRSYRKRLKAAGLSAIGGAKGKRLVATDLRAGALTHGLEETDNLPGAQAMAGHSRATTTALYVKPSLRAAEAFLGARWVGAKRRR
jgi:integrase